MKKLIALLLAALMLASLAACSSQSNGETVSDAAKVKLVTLSSPSWPVRDDWKVWEYIKEGTGMELEIQAIPNSDAGTKIPIMFAAPDTLPDLMALMSKPMTDKYATQGALIALDDVEEYMPNYNAFLASLPEADALRAVTTRKAADGKVYYSPTIGRESMQGVRAWLYRKDIFEKHNLAVPTNKDELIAVCRELKTLYPESYPFSMRDGLNFIEMIGPQWKPYFSQYAYYDFDNEKWCYGATEDTMLEIVTFLKQMRDEKLLMADFLTINTQSWQELITSDRGFIFPDYQTRIDFFTPLARMQNPDFTLSAMVPPIMNETTGTHSLAKYNLDNYGFVLCNTKDDTRIANAAKYLDWMYSDEGCELLTWGKEGETYNVVDGKRVFITDETGAQPSTLYGFSLTGTIARFDSAAIDSYESELIAEGRDIALNNMMPEANPVRWLAFNDDENAVMQQEKMECQSYTQETLSKFILGQEPLSNFDAFVAELYNIGVEKLLDTYAGAYNRVR